MDVKRRRRLRQYTDGTRYVVVSRPAEDMILDDNVHAPETMLVPAHAAVGGRTRGNASANDLFDDDEGDDADSVIAKKMMRGIRFGEDMEDDERLCNELFAEEEDDEELSDEDIANMMKVDPNRAYVTVMEKLPPRKGYRAANGALERQLARALEEVEADENYDEDDARVKGSLDLENMDDAQFELHGGLLDAMELGVLRDQENFFNEKAALAESTKAYLSHRMDLIEENDGTTAGNPNAVALDIVHVPIKKKQWDCESILSTYSNLYNHPSVVSATTTAQGIAGGILQMRAPKRHRVRPEANNLGMKEDSEEEEEDGTAPMLYVPQKKANETPEEKHERRKAIKEMQRLKRVNKKAMRTLYRTEDLRRQHIRSVAAKTASGAVPL